MITIDKQHQQNVHTRKKIRERQPRITIDPAYADVRQKEMPYKHFSGIAFTTFVFTIHTHTMSDVNLWLQPLISLIMTLRMISELIAYAIFAHWPHVHPNECGRAKTKTKITRTHTHTKIVHKKYVMSGRYTHVNADFLHVLFK